MVDYASGAYSETLRIGLGNCYFAHHSLLKDGTCGFVERDIVMKVVLMWILSVSAALFAGYLYGKSCAETQIVEKQVEVIKYVAQKRAKIQTKPNAGRDELLNLMRTGNL
ncbi:MAG: hypothetical protein MJ212_04720 [Alphaproteobacteria bacterium]|nr:hypothetical protein [Alphaproteobacteria bacterium]